MEARIDQAVIDEMRELYSDQEMDKRMVKSVNNVIDENCVILGDEHVFSQLPDDGARIGYAVARLAQSQDVFRSVYERDMTMPLVEKHGRVFHASDFENNPYLANISFDNCDLGRFSLYRGYYEPYQLLNYDVPKFVEGHYFTVPCVAYFTDGFQFPCFMEDNEVWMSVTPNEIFTMAKPIERAKGNVLTLGCGMGYFAYMAAIKPEVEHVTIVEIDSDVIKLFQSQILPQFPDPEKVTFVHADANDYMARLEDGAFDYCFADTWIGADSIDQYLKLYRLCKHFTKMEMDYWIEESFINSLLRIAFYQVKDAMDVARGKAPQPHMAKEDGFARAIDYIGRLLRNYSITTPEDIRNIIAPAKLKAAMDTSSIKF